MRVLLALLLISFIACKIAENLVEISYNFVSLIADIMKSRGILETFVDIAGKDGRNAAVDFCSSKLGGGRVFANICTILANVFASKLWITLLSNKNYIIRNYIIWTYLWFYK